MTFELPSIPENSDWFYPDEVASKLIARELKREIGPQHPLFSVSERLVVIAQCSANDDVLVLDPEDRQNVFCLHLTWSGTYDQMPTKYPEFLTISNTDLTRFLNDY
ncbi:hypothetical protein HOY34_12270 [Xinfangfangia sp. D13-10-4-6]|uniref:hypothetical protein n=1 Tax=Pseudogemmobacter hezensis TaxID=2737662 RepID=UPI0015570E05|nr:hypothetical protein [Pseudogemmobacter hezensis]NPD15974.1 hypothetical protein [Pseudogemmobacter hezensis]